MIAGGVRVLNVGLPLIVGAVPDSDVVQLDWRPPAFGDAEAGRLMAGLQTAQTRAANERAVELMQSVRPQLVSVRAAREVVPGMDAGRLLLHAGPPIAVERMCGPMLGALMGACVFEGWAASADEALALLRDGRIAVDPCHHHATVGPMAGVVSPSMPVVVAGRFVQGFGAGAVSAVSYAAIASAYDETARPRMLALLSSAWVVPGLVGPALAGFVADHAGWRPVFLGLVPPTLAAAALAIPPLRALPRTALAANAAASTRRLRSAVLLAAGVGATLAGVESERWLAGAPVLLAGLAVATPALVHLMPRGTLRAAPGQPAAIVVMALLGVAFFGAEAFVPLALTEVRGRSAAASGLPLTLGTIAWTAGSWIQERTAATRSRRGVIALGLVLLLAGIVGLAGVLHESVPVAAAYAAWTVTALGMGIAYSTTALTILEKGAAERAGESSAALQLATNLGIALGTGFGGALLAGVTAAGGSTAGGIAAAWAASAAALVLALAVTPRLGLRRPS